MKPWNRIRPILSHNNWFVVVIHPVMYFVEHEGLDDFSVCSVVVPGEIAVDCQNVQMFCLEIQKRLFTSCPP